MRADKLVSNEAATTEFDTFVKKTWKGHDELPDDVNKCFF
jgi:hypothetical protein